MTEYAPLLESGACFDSQQDLLGTGPGGRIERQKPPQISVQLLRQIRPPSLLLVQSGPCRDLFSQLIKIFVLLVEIVRMAVW